MEGKTYKVLDLKELIDKDSKVVSKKAAKTNKGFMAKIKKGTKKLIVVVLCAAALTGAYHVGNQIGQNFNSTSIVETIEVEDETFEANSEKEMTERVSNFIIDMKREGYDISYVDGASFYIYANGSQLSEDFISELHFSQLTEEEMTKSVNKVANYLKEAYMDNRPIDVTSMFSDPKDVELLNIVLGLSKDWDTQDKKEVTARFNEFVEKTYNSNEYTEYNSYANVLAITLLRGQLEKTVNSGYTIISKDMQDRLWGTEVNCFTVDKNGNQVLNGNDIYSREYRTVKESITNKLSNANYDYSIKEEDTLGYRILLNVAKNVKNSGVELGKRVNVQEIRDKNNNINKTTTQTTKPSSNSSSKNTTTNKNTTTETPRAEKPVEEQKQEIQEEIKQEAEEKKEEIKEEANLWQTGYDKGFADGVAGASKNGSHSNKSYTEGYNRGYAEGYAIYEMTLETEEEVVVEETYEFEDGVYVDPSTGYVYKDGVQQFNEDGTPLVIGGNGQEIKVLTK